MTKPTENEFLNDVLRGLSEERKSLPSKYFYDERGSELFNRICELEEYYLTRTEERILNSMLPALAERMGPHCAIYEFGPGSPRKVSAVLAPFQEPEAYVPVEISQAALLSTVAEIQKTFPSLPVFPIRADFTSDELLSSSAPEFRKGRLGMLLGSTLGNFDPENGTLLLRNLSNWIGKGSFLLIGTDLRKDPSKLEAAYNDHAGITAAFNLNLLARINRELHADFDPEQFEHRAFFNSAQSRIEMHLISRRTQRVRIGDAGVFRFYTGETIHTENSYKYAPEAFSGLARSAGLSCAARWTDPEGLYSLHLVAS